MSISPYWLRSWRTRVTPEELSALQEPKGSVRPMGWAVRFFFWLQRLTK